MKWCGLGAGAAALLMLGSGAVGGPSSASAHPLHTSLVEISHDSRSGSVVVSLRAFVDDFTRAASIRRQQLIARGGSPKLSPLVDYALATLIITDASGRTIPLRSCGGKQVGDLMWLCFRGAVPRGKRQLKVSSQILFDQFRDQINIVKAVTDGKSSNLLFTPGDKAKQLP